MPMTQLLMPDTIAVPEFKSNLFDYNARTKTFVAESSTLTQGSRKPQFGDVDSQRGFVLVSAKTGVKVTYIVTSIDSSGDDIAGWRCSPYGYDIPDEAKGTSVLIIND